MPALLADTAMFLYGTTRGTNAIVERKTAHTAFLTTGGFPDILLLKEGGKSEPHNLQMDYPAPYIPRRLTFEIPERVNAEGGIETALNEAAVRAVLATLGTRGIEAIAVCLLWSIANPVHELRVGQLIEAVLPGMPYTLSHQLNRILREYRRASSTAIDASLKPLMQQYLLTLETDLRAAGYHNDLGMASVAVHSIGAGGGSIAWVDCGGLRHQQCHDRRVQLHRSGRAAQRRQLCTDHNSGRRRVHQHHQLQVIDHAHLPPIIRSGIIDLYLPAGRRCHP